MKVWIDKHGGYHYHKQGCRLMLPMHNPPHFKYEEIEHRIRKSKYIDDYADIIVEHRRYVSCPFCFTYKPRGNR